MAQEQKDPAEIIRGLHRLVLEDYNRLKIDNQKDAEEFAVQKRRLEEWGRTVGFEGAGPLHPNFAISDRGPMMCLLGMRQDFNNPLNRSYYGIREGAETEAKSKGLFKKLGFRRKEKDQPISLPSSSESPALVATDRKLFKKLLAEMRACNNTLEGDFPPTDSLMTDTGRSWRLERLLDEIHRGGLKLYPVGPDDKLANVYTTISWRGIDAKDTKAEDVQVDEDIRDSALDLYRRHNFLQAPPDSTISSEIFNDSTHVLLDPETQADYESSNPGTITVAGYGYECWDYEIQHGKARPIPPEYLPIKAPEVGKEQILRMYKELHPGTVQPPNDEESKATFKELTGASTIYPEMDAEIVYSIINKSDKFVDFATAWNFSVELKDTEKVVNLLYQVALSKELERRMLLLKKPTFHGFTPKVVASLNFSRLWIRNTELIAPPEAPTSGQEIRFRSLVVSQQAQGLLDFARKIQWPFLDEVAIQVEKMPAEMEPQQDMPLELKNWLYGSTLPGKHMSRTIMSALIQATPSLASMSALQPDDSGVVLEGQSYWRVRSVLGRLFGSLPGISSQSGWVGPCPAVGLPEKNQIVQLNASRVPSMMNKEQKGADYVGPDFDAFQGIQQHQGESREAYLADVTNKEAYMVPKEPKGGIEAKYVETRMEKSESDASLAARAVFEVGGESKVYALTTNPAFITLPPCRPGPKGCHEVHRREIEGFQKVWPIDRLREIPNGEKIVIINATGEGAETLARAWCAEIGRDAIIRHDKGACFACCVRNVGRGGLGNGVLIWA